MIYHSTQVNQYSHILLPVGDQFIIPGSLWSEFRLLIKKVSIVMQSHACTYKNMTEYDWQSNVTQSPVKTSVEGYWDSQLYSMR